MIAAPGGALKHWVQIIPHHPGALSRLAKAEISITRSPSDGLYPGFKFIDHIADLLAGEGRITGKTGD